jgi:quinol monooxygenase YgiN
MWSPNLAEEMDMLVVIARVQAKQGQQNMVAAMLAPAAQASREDSGCRFYRAYSDVEDPTSFTTYEEWDS